MSRHASRRRIPSVLVVPLALGSAALGSAVLGSAPPGAAAPRQAPVVTSVRGAAADPSGAITWTVESAGPDGPDGRVSLRHVVESGGAVTDQVVVTGFSGRPASFRVYAGDGSVTAAGNFDLVPAGTEPVDGGSWVALGAVEGGEPGGSSLVMDLAAGATAMVSAGDRRSGRRDAR